MALLSSLGLKPKAVVNDGAAHAAALRVVRMLADAAYTDALAALGGTSAENRERLIYGLASNGQAVELAARWAVARPQCALAHTVLGASLIVTGFKRRSDSDADDVDPGAWKPFLASLTGAQEPLQMAARLDPASADPWGWMIHAALGAGGERAELKDLFQQAVSRELLHWPAHYKYFNATTEKWGGSHEEMFHFARRSTLHAPRGSILHSLIPMATNDYAMALGRRSHERIRAKSNAAAIVSALHAWVDTDAQGLPRKLERLAGGFARHGLNHFCVACYLCGARDEARVLLQALGGEIESTPWAWIAAGPRERLNPAFAYDRVGRELGIEAP